MSLATLWATGALDSEIADTGAMIAPVEGQFVAKGAGVTRAGALKRAAGNMSLLLPCCRSFVDHLRLAFRADHL